MFLVHVTSNGNWKILGHDSNSSLCSWLMSLLTVTGKFSVMIATLLYVLVHVHVTSNGNRKILGHDSNSSLCSWLMFMSLLTVTGKFSVMIATLLYVLGSCHF